ncbi:hypothetical protein CEXT_721261 [Caerostris extrusa]|uniref:Secreted protein n=1 Tax=Caerostris extrusa TaxID=172846 RepID=A0AAV4QBB0_CAEEX|nr:hypothetical protein CEXT_721261 [Caerostris extrusa]
MKIVHFNNCSKVSVSCLLLYLYCYVQQYVFAVIRISVWFRDDYSSDVYGYLKILYRPFLENVSPITIRPINHSHCATDDTIRPVVLLPPLSSAPPIPRGANDTIKTFSSGEDPL